MREGLEGQQGLGALLPADKNLCGPGLKRRGTGTEEGRQRGQVDIGEKNFLWPDLTGDLISAPGGLAC